MSHQKVLQHVAAEAATSALQSLLQLATRAHTGDGGGLGLAELVPLLAMVYSLLGPQVEAEAEAEQRLREALLQACLRDERGGGLLPERELRAAVAAATSGGGGGGGGGEVGDFGFEEVDGPAGAASEAELMAAKRDVLAPALRELFARLRAVAAARRGLGPRAEALLLPYGQQAEAGAGEVYRPLLRHLFERMLAGEDVSELQRLSGGGSIVASTLGVTGSLLKKGAQMLGVRAKAARPTDAKLVVVYVVGGISLGEVRELRQLFAQHPRHRLLLGGTHLTSPASLAKQLLQGLHEAEALPVE